MKKSSWIVLAACAVLSCLLGFIFVQSRKAPPEMTTERFTSMLDAMKHAVETKSVTKLMTYVDSGSDTKVSSLNHDQLRLLLSRAFNQSEQFVAEYSNVSVRPGADESVAEFNLRVSQRLKEGLAEDYHGHITLTLKLEDVPHLLGIYHTREWTIVRGVTDGPDLAGYGDY